MTTVERFFVLSILAMLLAVAFKAAPGFAGETLDAVKSRSVLRCGVSEGIAGFSERNTAGRWTGLDVDFCRAVAAAVIGDPAKVEFVPLKASARFPALQAGKIDLLLRNTTWTLGLEAGLKVQFPGILFFDGQGFMVPGKKGAQKIEQLNGATVCVEKGTTHVQNLADYFAFRNMQVKPLVLDSVREVTDAFLSGRCRACTSDASQLAAMRLKAPGGSSAFVILRWVLFALIAAEENNLTQDNIAALLRDSRHPALRRAAALEGGFGKALGLNEDWAVRAVQAAGNYGEMFDRNLGRSSALQLDRGAPRCQCDVCTRHSGRKGNSFGSKDGGGTAGPAVRGDGGGSRTVKNRHLRTCRTPVPARNPGKRQAISAPACSLSCSCLCLSAERDDSDPAGAGHHPGCSGARGGLRRADGHDSDHQQWGRIAHAGGRSCDLSCGEFDRDDLRSVSSAGEFRRPAGGIGHCPPVALAHGRCLAKKRSSV